MPKTPNDPEWWDAWAVGWKAGRKPHVEVFDTELEATKRLRELTALGLNAAAWSLAKK